MGRLDRKTCIVTGAGRGIGEAIARAFAREGAVVVVTDKVAEPAASLANEIGAHWQCLDVASEADWAALADAWPACDVLVNNAGITGFEAPQDIRAFNITVEGNTLRYTDTTDDRDRLMADASTAPAFATLLGAQGALLDVTGYYDAPTGTTADVLAGTAYGDAASGYVPASSLAGGSPPKISQIGRAHV